MKIFIYLDIDGVICLGSEINPKLTKWGYVHRFNPKAVIVLNDILQQTNADIIISSDWRHHHSLTDLQEIFEWQKVIKLPIDVTPISEFITLHSLESYRASDILEHVGIHKPDKWVSIDDLYLIPYLPENNFVFIPRWMEGIKQTGKKQEIINKLLIL